MPKEEDLAASATKLRWRLIAREAQKRITDAEILASNSPPELFSDSAHLLALLGFELMLKLYYEQTSGERAPKHHYYHKIFDQLTEESKSKILTAAAKCIGPSGLTSDSKAVLKDWSANFIGLRYPYESYDGMSEADYTLKGKTWRNRGMPSNEATFRFHPVELHAMLLSLSDLTTKILNRRGRSRH